MIRKYSTKDIENLLNLIRLNTPKYFNPKEEADFIYYLDNEIEDYFVVEENSVIVGCGGINYDENNAVISWDIIHPEYSKKENTAVISWDIIHPGHHGKGIGKKLLEYRVNFVKENSDYKTIVVRTSHLTDKFYEKLGFKLEFIKKDYWAEGYDLYQMKLEL